MKTLNLKVDGMRCGGCSARLQRVLEALPQVESCKADHVTKAVELVLKEDLPLDAIKKAVESIGFKVIG
jgi:copper chaperone CopZ